MMMLVVVVDVGLGDRPLRRHHRKRHVVEQRGLYCLRWFRWRRLYSPRDRDGSTYDWGSSWRHLHHGRCSRLRNDLRDGGGRGRGRGTDGDQVLGESNRGGERITERE